MKQVAFEEIQVGTPVPSYTVVVNLQQLVRYAEASRDYARIHVDEEVGRRSPWGTIILHGMIKSGFLARAAGDFAGAGGVVRRVRIEYRRPDVPGDTLTIGGSVVGKYGDGGDHLVECDLWLRNGKGEVTTTGSALIALPSGQNGRRPSWSPIPPMEPPVAGGREDDAVFPDTARIRGLAGVPWKPWTAATNAFWIKLFCRAVGDTNPLYVDEEFAASGPYGAVIAPPTFPAALDPFYRHNADQEARPREMVTRSRPGGNGWDEFEHFAPIRAGDVITSYGKWIAPYEKPGRSGTLVFVPREVVYVNQRREIVARSRGAIIQVA